MSPVKARTYLGTTGARLARALLVFAQLLCLPIHVSTVSEHAKSWHPRRARATDTTARVQGGGEKAAHGTAIRWFTKEERLAQVANLRQAGRDARKKRQEDERARLTPPPPTPEALEDGTWDDCRTCREFVPTVPVWPPEEGRAAEAPPVPPTGSRCHACTGATVSLARLGGMAKLKGRNRKVFLGASGAAVLRGNTTTGPVIVKMWCGIQGEYHQTHAHPAVPEGCRDDPSRSPPARYIHGGDCPLTVMGGHGRCNQKFLTALDRIYEAANLTAITPRSWTAPVVSGHPGPAPGATNQRQSKGERVSVVGQFYGVAPGVSLEAFTGGHITPENYQPLLDIPPWQVLMAATADLLVSESDRHGQNVMIDEQSNIQLIDNEGAFGSTNSLWLPGTQKYEIYRVGYAAVCCGNLPPGNCPGPVAPAAPEQLLDYRCFAPGGTIGFDYPPGVMAFLKRMKSVSAEEMMSTFGMSDVSHAKLLKKRTDWMRELGFEETLERVLAGHKPGDGVNYGNHYSYRVHPPCCRKDSPDCAFRSRSTALPEYKLPVKVDG